MPFDTNKLSMERINMINSITGIRKKFNVTDYEYVGILNYIHSMQDLPENKNRYEDILFENIVRLIKKQHLSSWIGGQIGELIESIKVEKDLTTTVATVAHDSVIKYDNDKSPAKLFKMYCNVDEQLSMYIPNYDIPEMSVISALTEMYQDATVKHPVK